MGFAVARPERTEPLALGEPTGLRGLVEDHSPRETPGLKVDPLPREIALDPPRRPALAGEGGGATAAIGRVVDKLRPGQALDDTLDQPRADRPPPGGADP